MKLELLTQNTDGKGHETPILFVHGAWHGAWCWQVHFMPYFAQQGYNVYALSLRGHGKSEGADKLRWTTIADYVADVAQIVAQLPASPIIIGHSMGGMVTQKYLESHQAPAGVLLASVPPKGVLATSLRIAMRHTIPFLKVNFTLNLYPLIATPALAHDAFFSAEMPQAQVERYHAKMDSEAYRAFLDMMLFNLPKPKKVTTPLLVLGAENDTIFHPAEIKATAKAYQTEAQIFPNMAHDMMLEAGWQSVADTILAWLAERGFNK